MTTKLVCFRHPNYDGQDSPELTCKTCCGIFIDLIKQQNAAQDVRTASEQEQDQPRFTRDEVNQSIQKRFGIALGTI